MNIEELEKLVNDLSDDSNSESEKEEIKPEPKKERIYKKPKSVENIKKARKTRALKAVKKTDERKKKLLNDISGEDVLNIEPKLKNYDDKIESMYKMIYDLHNKKQNGTGKKKTIINYNVPQKIENKEEEYQKKQIKNILNL